MAGCDSIWTGDDFSGCFRQRYVDLNALLLTYDSYIGELPYAVTASASLAVLGYRWVRTVRTIKAAPKKDTETEPLIQRQDEAEEVYEHERLQATVSYGALDKAPQAMDPTLVEDGSATKPNVTIVKVIRDHKERAKVAVEMSAVVTMAALSLGSMFVNSINGEWVDAPMLPFYQFGFWLYALVILSCRLHYINSDSKGLWYHSTIMYPIVWCLSCVNLWSTFIHPYSCASRWFYVTEWILASVLFVTNYTARIGDKPARVYLCEEEKPSQEPVTGLFSLMTFSYISPMIWTGNQRPLELTDVWSLREEDHAYNVLRKFRRLNARAWFGYRVIRHFKHELILTCTYAAIFSFFLFAPTVLLQSILEYVEDPTSVSRPVAWLYVFGMLFFAVVNNAINGQALFIGRRICIRVRALIIGEVYAKALRRKVASSGDGSLGKNKNKDGQANTGAIMNLMSIDSFKVSELSGYLHYFVSAICQIVIAVALLYRVLDWSALVGAAGMGLISPLNYWFSKAFSRIQREMLALTDERVEKTNEMLQCIRIIKFFAWEDRFAERITEVREKELKALKRRYIYWAFGQCLFYGVPLCVTALSFGCYTLVQGRVLTSSLAFTALALFNILRAPMDQIADLLSRVLQTKVSMDRLQEYLDEGDTQKYNQLNVSRGPNSPYVGFENASFSWGSAGGYNFKLQDININFPVGKMTVVAGPTGAGKTSLLMALLGEMDLVAGAVFLPGGGCNRETMKPDPNTGFTENVAYCAQQAWLLNDTVQSNILFASEYNEERYQQVLTACSLQRDMEILDYGDKTEIGEKGITLSGGQKQRISLARAIYSRSRHLLLDDCLSAVDSDTALRIYQDCLCGPLTENRTVILVSHNVSLTVGRASHVILVENGRVKTQGSPTELVSSGDLDPDFVRSSQSSVAHTRASSVTKLNDSSDSEAETKTSVPREGQNLIKDETMERGHVDKKVYFAYLGAMGKYWYWFGFVGILVLQRAADLGQSWWLREWTVKGMVSEGVMSLSAQFGGHTGHVLSLFAEELQSSTHGSGWYLTIYMLIGLANIVVSSSKEIFVYVGSISASQKLFKRMLASVLHAKGRFFDSTPIGRVMNRFSKDLETIDQGIAPLTMGLFRFVLSAVTTALLIASITPSFLIASVFVFGTYWYIGQLYLNTSRELKRMDSVSRSPIFQQFGETLSGVSTIRAYGDQQRFIQSNMERIDKNNQPFFYMWMANRWLSFRVDTAGGVVSFCASALVVMNVDRIDSGLAGLSLSYALAFNNLMLWAVRFYAEIEMNLNSVERVMDTVENVETEAAMVIPDSRPPPHWPTHGEIEFDNYNMRYADGLPLVVKNVSFKVQPFNKVGIVGRTGAGKSSLIGALFRLVEADSGCIKIDGLDISTIGLRDLRQALAVIPQDPTLFVGTVRSNLDPFEQYTDDQVFEALRRVHLISASHQSVASGENTNQFLDLGSQISEGGSNLSQGQRQLMCLARSLLKAPKVLLLDEATASIDYTTDARIQKTIREEFQTTTLLTIAHRLRSIVDYDKILVLDAGEVVEYDNPHALLEEDTVFRDMCAKSGELDILRELAQEAYQSKH